MLWLSYTVESLEIREQDSVIKQFRYNSTRVKMQNGPSEG